MLAIHAADAMYYTPLVTINLGISHVCIEMKKKNLFYYYNIASFSSKLTGILFYVDVELVQ